MRCPICGKSESKRIYRLCDNLKILGKTFSDEPAYLVSCDSCGMVYMETAASQEDFLDYYKNGAVAAKYCDLFGAENTENYYRHLLDILERYMTPNSRILDVAGAWGELGKYLCDHGYPNVTNVDPNEDCAAESIQKGIRTVVCSSSDMAQMIPEKYDMIILNHALEHIVDVEALMRGVEQLLSERGTVFIEVPDAEGYETEEMAPYNFLTYEHVLHFSGNDLENLAVRYGYEIREMKKYYKEISSYPSIYAVLRKCSTVKRTIRYSDSSRKSVERYLAKSRAALDGLIKPLEKSQEEVTLWGIGASTTILLDAFQNCNVTALIDKNPNRQGLVFHIGDRRLTIEEPKTEIRGTIVVLSIPYADSIRRQIRNMGIRNKVVTLHSIEKE